MEILGYITYGVFCFFAIGFVYWGILKVLGQKPYRRYIVAGWLAKKLNLAVYEMYSTFPVDPYGGGHGLPVLPVDVGYHRAELADETVTENPRKG